MTSLFYKLLVGISLIVSTLVALPASASQTILVFGDSLSAAYGIQQEQGWVALLQKRLVANKHDYKIVNASISGETSSGGLSRFNQALTKHQPHIVIIELGGNDGMRGLSLAALQNNLDAMITQAKKTKAKLLLLGMKIPPNYGVKYSRDFNFIFQQLAKQHKTNLVPFLLEGIAGNPDLMQNDGLHPTSAAQPLILGNVWPALKPLIN